MRYNSPRYKVWKFNGWWWAGADWGDREPRSTYWFRTHAEAMQFLSPPVVKPDRAAELGFDDWPEKLKEFYR